MANKVNLDVAEKLDITCRRGDTFSLTLTLKDSSGTALQLSTLGYEFLMDVKTGRKQTDEGLKRDVVASSSLSKSTSKVDPKLSNGFQFTDITDSGTVKVTASADTMRSIPVGAFVYDIQQKVGDEVTTILTGSFRVKEDISN
jgi:hypothetical protein|tara:strand:- start:72 stop:500 length:429 start_codon:yes stop_codon:yes gene_type:complete